MELDVIPSPVASGLGQVPAYSEDLLRPALQQPSGKIDVSYQGAAKRTPLALLVFLLLDPIACCSTFPAMNPHQAWLA